MIEFSPKVIEEFEAIVSRYPHRQAALLPTLRLIEREFGEVSHEGLRYAATLLGLSPARAYGVFSFYSHFRVPGQGRYLIQVCATLPCALAGCEAVFDHLRKRLGIGRGETTQDKIFTLKKVECLAACDRAPAIQVNDDYYDRVTPESLDKLLAELTLSEAPISDRGRVEGLRRGPTTSSG